MEGCIAIGGGSTLEYKIQKLSKTGKLSFTYLKGGIYCALLTLSAEVSFSASGEDIDKVLDTLNSQADEYMHPDLPGQLCPSCRMRFL